MSKRTTQLIGIAIATSFVTLASSNFASAQDVVVVNTVTPTVVGHTVEPAGLFGFRTRVRPIVAPVVTPVAVKPVTVVRPVVVVPSRAPVVRYTTPAVVPTYYVPAPVVRYAAPPARIVTPTYVGF